MFSLFRMMPDYQLTVTVAAAKVGVVLGGEWVWSWSVISNL